MVHLLEIKLLLLLLLLHLTTGLDLCLMGSFIKNSRANFGCSEDSATVKWICLEERTNERV